MDLKFISLDIQNFFSIKNLSLDYTKLKGTSVVIGDNKDISDLKNGCGKSALFISSLLWTIYGKTPVSLKNCHIPNRTITHFKRKPTKLSLKLLSNNKPYLIISGLWNKQGSTYCRIYTGHEEIEKNHITKSSIKETRKYIEKNIIGMSFELFTSCVLLTSSSQNDFLMMDKYRKRQYIDEIFNLTVFGNIFQNVRRDNNALDTDILLNVKQQKALENSIQKIEDKATSFKTDTQEEKNIIKKRLSVLRKKLLNETFTKNELNKKSVLEKRLSGHINKREFTQDTLTKINHLISDMKKDITHGKNILNKHSKVVSLICNDCYPKIDKTFELSKIKDKIQTFEQKIISEQEEIKQLKNNETQLKDKINTLTKELDFFKKKEKELYENVLSNRYNAKQIVQYEETLSKLQSKVNPFSNLINEHKDELNDVKKLLIKQYLKKEYLDAILYIVGDEGAKKYIIKDLVNIVNNLVVKYLNIMGSSYTIIFDEVFDYILLTESGETSFNNFSSGERARINMSILFAFKELLSLNNSIQSNLFIVDEILDVGLDSPGFRRCIQIISEECNEKEQSAIIISHRDLDNLYHFFNNKILVTIKQKATTYVVEEAKQREL
jgi:DNA repair exonuclease SbcCD ATPase subunit